MKTKVSQTKRYVILDFNCHLHACYHIVQTGLNSARAKGLKLENYIKSVVALRLNTPIDFMNIDAEMLICDDTKVDGKYWRHDIVPHYKGQRKEKDQLFKDIRRIALEYVEQYKLAYYAEPLLEADDLIAYWCKRLGADKSNQVFISSVDGDLQQLVTSNVFFAWTYSNSSTRLFNTSLVQDYIFKKFKVRIDCPTEIAALKALKGDSSDNLKRNSPIEVIDLNECHFGEYVAPLALELKTYVANVEHIEKAKEYARKFALPMPATAA